MVTCVKTPWKYLRGFSLRGHQNLYYHYKSACWNRVFFTFFLSPFCKPCFLASLATFRLKSNLCFLWHPQNKIWIRKRGLWNFGGRVQEFFLLCGWLFLEVLVRCRFCRAIPENSFWNGCLFDHTLTTDSNPTFWFISQISLQTSSGCFVRAQ